MINKLYKKIHGVNNEPKKYNVGMVSIMMFDSLARRNMIGIVPLIIKIINLGDFTYKKNLDRLKPYLNLNKEVWYNPETGEENKQSFDDLWKRSIEVALETIEDVNRYLYKDKELTNKMIMDDTSFNTGLPCEKGQFLKYIKRYKK